jgi:hypothetical protein
MLASAAAAAIVAGSTFALLQNSDGSSSDADSSRSNAASGFSDDDPPVRECRERVEGGKRVPNRTVDTVIGPVAFIRLPMVYRKEASRPDSELISIGLLRAGARVTLEVPRSQRRWLKLLYDYPDFKGAYAITLQGCRRLYSARARRCECGWRPYDACRWRYTQFTGGFRIDYANAPRRGRCAELVVRAKAEREPLREFLFDPEPGACDGHTPATTGDVRLAHPPTAITNACARAATHAAFPVLCPARWPSPRGRGAPKARRFGKASDIYLINAENGFNRRGGHVYHLLVGGQRQPLGPEAAGVDPEFFITTRKVTTPTRGGGASVQQLPARRIASARVHDARAVVVRQPPYPEGGLHGGHVIVLWNEDGHGYFVSVHGERLSQRALVAIALAMARSMRPSGTF